MEAAGRLFAGFLAQAIQPFGTSFLLLGLGVISGRPTAPVVVFKHAFSLVGWVDSHKGGPDLIPADGMARGLTYPVAPEQIIVAAKSLFTCCVSYPRFRLCVAPLAKGRPLSTRGLARPFGSLNSDSTAGASRPRHRQASSLSCFSAAGVEGSRATLSGRLCAVFIFSGCVKSGTRCCCVDG